MIEAAEFTAKYPAIARICNVADPELAGCVWHHEQRTEEAELLAKQIPDSLVESFFVEDGDPELNGRLGAQVGLSADQVDFILRACRFAGGA